ncbi:MAG: Bacteriophage Mu Gam like protein [Chthonomonadales bacterium]|nr:Bacteriophage Mu Gam like protein [Chthonomonadales bacterium]
MIAQPPTMPCTECGDVRLRITMPNGLCPGCAELETAGELPPVRPEGFHICDERSANWLLRKLANIAAEKRRVTAQADEILRQLDADAQRLQHLFGAELEQFARHTLATTGSKRRSLTLLQGTLSFRTIAPALRVSDTAAAIRWAKQHAPALVTTTTTEEIDAKAFRDLAKIAKNTDGELLPGISISEGGENFSISFGKTD